MQLRKSDYDSGEHYKFKALSVFQPYASYIADGEKKIEIRSRNTSYRGDLVICSTKNPKVELKGGDVKDYIYGGVLCIVELYDVCLFKELSNEEKAQTKIPQNQWKQYGTYYAWKLRNVRRIIEKPVKGGQGIWNMYCTDEYIMEYPQELGQPSPTQEERIKELTDHVRAIKYKSRWGLLTIFVGALVVVAAIFAIIKFFLWLVAKFA